MSSLDTKMGKRRFELWNYLKYYLTNLYLCKYDFIMVSIDH